VPAGVCAGIIDWVQPARRRAATRQTPIKRRRVFFDVMIYLDRLVRHCIKGWFFKNCCSVEILIQNKLFVLNTPAGRAFVKKP
jgi:hypothetical protein